MLKTIQTHQNENEAIELNSAIRQKLQRHRGRVTYE